MSSKGIRLEFPGGRGSLPQWKGPIGPLIISALAVIFALSSYFQVAPYERAVVLRFGEFNRKVDPGPAFRIPFVESVRKVETEKQHKLEFGFRTVQPGQRTVYQKEGYGNESLMLTGDLNIADVEWVVQYKIEDPFKYLFSLRKPEETIRSVSEAEMRGSVGDMGFDEVIKSKRSEIEEQVRLTMQEDLDRYDSGISIKLVQLQDVLPPAPVKDSFEEVNRALQEMERAINEALQERNKVIFLVQGEAKQRIAQAEGRKIERINEAEGDASRFLQLLAAYRLAPDVTRRRLYLEAMQETLPGLGRILVVDDSLEGLLPVLDLQGKMFGSAKGGG